MHILLVDDDSAIIKALLPILSGLPGHHVRVATTVEKAMEHAESAGEVHLLVTDVVMEPTDGFTLRDQLRERFPRLRTILLTGYDLSDYPEQTEGYSVLMKPVDVKELRTLAASELQAAAAEEAAAIAEAAEEEVLELPLPGDGKTLEAAQAVSPEEPPVETPTVEAPPVEEPPRIRHTVAPGQGGTQSQAPMAAPPASAPVPASEVKEPPGPPVAKPVPQAPAAPSVPKIRLPADPEGASATPSPVAEPPKEAGSKAAPKLGPPKAPVPVAAALSKPTPKLAPPAATPATPATPAAPAPPAATPKLAVPKAAPPATAASAVAPVAPKAAMPPAGAAPTAPSAAAAPFVPRAGMPSGTAAKPVVRAAPPQGKVPSAVPVKVPAGARPATPRASATPMASAEGTEADELTGRQLGAYRLIRKIGSGDWGPVYEAEQTNMGRLVALKVLSQERQEDPEAKKRFIANASAKANVQHPRILSVYEAGETDGHCYYTHEYVDGESLAQIAAAGRTVEDSAALQAVRVAAEGLAFMGQQKLPRSSITAGSIYIGSDKRPRLANLATWKDDDHPDTQNEIRVIAEAVSSVLPNGKARKPDLQGLLDRMRAEGGAGILSWPALVQSAKALEPKVKPADAFRLSAQDEAAIRAVEDEKARQKRTMLLTIGSTAVVALIVGLAIYWMLFASNERITAAELVEIPAGEFIYQKGEKKVLPVFWIDKYEVTIGQYARFLKYLSEHPGPDGKPTREFDHADQPAGKSHTPLHWDIYYGRAKWGKPAKFVPIDLNSPIFNVDWWDAYAYAKWQGRRLPTEEEWEKAARGTDGRKYPWGNEFDPKKVNSKSDYIMRPGPDSKATVDGWFWWSPVDAIKEDSSPYGVVGMAGNLNEWTGSWEKAAQGRFPVLRGGSYRSDSNEVTFRFVGLDPERAEEFIGFRTASSEPPIK